MCPKGALTLALLAFPILVLECLKNVTAFFTIFEGQHWGENVCTDGQRLQSEVINLIGSNRSKTRQKGWKIIGLTSKTPSHREARKISSFHIVEKVAFFVNSN